MSGVKGRSGRKSTSDEAKRLKIIDKAWAIVGEILNNPNISMYDKDVTKAAVAQAIILKDLARRLEGTTSQISQIIYNIKSSDKLLSKEEKANIGERPPVNS